MLHGDDAFAAKRRMLFDCGAVSLDHGPYHLSIIIRQDRLSAGLKHFVGRYPGAGENLYVLLLPSLHFDLCQFNVSAPTCQQY